MSVGRCNCRNVHEDFDRCYRAVQSKDARFDGWFVTAVSTTRIYCWPSCPVRAPFALNVQFYPTAAAAQRAGFRACKRCRPDASPGFPEWNIRGDVVARAMRLIGDGTVDREGVGGLARHVGYTSRQLERLLQAEVAASPLALARAQRTQTARVLIETTDLPLSDVAFAAGFSSIRQFNGTVRTVCGTTPTALRKRAAGRFDCDVTSPGRVSLRLPVRKPFTYQGVFGHLAASAVAGCEEVHDGQYRRTLRLPNGNGIVSLRPAPDHVRCLLVLDDFRDLPTAIARCRRLLDLDADPQAVIEVLADDPDIGRVVAKAPGQRIARTVDAAEVAGRVVLGQQVSTKAARTHAGRLVAAYGEPVDDAQGTLTHSFPSVEQLAELGPDPFSHTQGPPAEPGRADHRGHRWQRRPGCGVRPGTFPLALPRIGPWSAELIAMRGLGDPDAFPAGDLDLRLAAEQVGLPHDQRPLNAHSARWRPWRSYATQHLWTTLKHPMNHLPSQEIA
jgi:AraC family transcriptional regulator of adaptative response / DNA-3-methyladenine glycosylase II